MESAASTVQQRLLPVPRQEHLIPFRWRSSSTRLLQRHGMQWPEPITLASSAGFTSARKNATTITGLAAGANAPEMPPQVQDVVIIGGGIAGLATALALHRLGVKSVLLEQSEQLRTAGATIGMWTNAWRALEALGVADSLREKFVKLAGLDFYAADGNCLLSLGFQDGGAREVEVRGVERKALLEALREPLPDGIVFYDSQVVGIRKLDGGYTEVECKNGSKIQTKVLIGCDGAGSIVARWMGFKEPRYAGYTATRGLAVFPNGNKMKNATQILGQGVRAGILPMDSNRIFWFVVFNSSGEKITDAELVRKEALNYVQGWPDIIADAINKSPLETLNRRGISDRWMWPVGLPPLYRGGVTLAGDAMHPMTPNLAQGGCCSLEDAVILGRALSKALSVRNSTSVNGSHADEMERIELALKSYTEERRQRMFPMAIRSYAIGALLQLDSEIACSARNKLIPKILKLERFVGHTFYDCGKLL